MLPEAVALAVSRQGEQLQLSVSSSSRRGSRSGAAGEDQEILCAPHLEDRRRTPMGTDMEATENGQDIVIEAGSGIDGELELRIKQQATRFRTAYRRTVEEAWKLGHELRQAKEQVRHGQWIPWLEGEIGLTPRTAQRLMALNEAYVEMRHVSHLSSVSDALRALPSGSKSERSPGQGASAEFEAAQAAPKTAPASEGGGAKSVQDLTRVVERLESVVEAIPRVSARNRTSQFPVLCRALQSIVSLMLQHANQASADTADGVTKPAELVSSLDAALAKVREFNDSITARG